MALGPGVPDPPPNLAARSSKLRHRLYDVASVCSKEILGGLHHEYSPAHEQNLLVCIVLIALLQTTAVVRRRAGRLNAGFATDRSLANRKPDFESLLC